MYTVAVVGNSLIMAAVQADPALHEPMHLFLSMLAATEVGVSVSTLPTVMGILWFDACQVGFDGCLAQMFFSRLLLHGVRGPAGHELRLLCSHLQSTALHSHPAPAPNHLRGPGHCAQGVTLMAALPVLLRRLPYCHSNILSRSYCLHSDPIQLPCADTRLNSLLGLAMVWPLLGWTRCSLWSPTC